MAEAEFCWKRWEAPRRNSGVVLQEDLDYWKARLGREIELDEHPNRSMRWALRRKWEVDDRHIFLGLLKCSECDAVSILIEQGLTLETARQKLCAVGQ